MDESANAAKRGSSFDFALALCGRAADVRTQSRPLNFMVVTEILQGCPRQATNASPKATIGCVRARVYHIDADHSWHERCNGADWAVGPGGCADDAALELIEYEGAPYGLFFTHQERLTGAFPELLADDNNRQQL